MGDMNTTTTPKVTFRKTKTGEWVAFGPADFLARAAKLDCAVDVTLAKGGTKSVAVERIGKPFDVDGTAMAYGYLVADRPAGRRGSFGRTCSGCGETDHNRDASRCWECGMAL